MSDANTPQTYLAFDFGRRRIGVASGQNITRTAEPVTTLNSIIGQPDWASIDRLIKTWRPSALVVGIPLHLDGKESDLTLAAREFAASLAERAKLTVHEVDERLSSRAAESLYADQRAAGRKHNKKAPVDALAAMIILESFFAETTTR